MDVANHHDSCFNLGLSAQQKSDLVEYLKSRSRNPSEPSAASYAGGEAPSPRAEGASMA